jgi:hypothetical protein
LKSVSAAAETLPAPPNTVAQESGNAFSTPVAASQDNVAGQQPSQWQRGIQGNYVVYQPPMDRGVSPGMANAFTQGGTSRPIPSNFGPPAQVPSAFSDGNTANVRTYVVPAPGQSQFAVMQPAPMDRSPTPPRPVVSTKSSSEGSNVQLMAMLRDSLFPSQREAAAEALATRDWRADPRIIDTLVKSARNDEAPMVRAECVRSLSRFGVASTPIMDVCQALKSDPDPKVRQEADQTLKLLATYGRATDPMVRPATATQPK